MSSSDRDSWNSRFASEAYVFGTRPASFVADNAHYIPPRSHVLVPADGEGRNSVFLAELGHRVVAIDIAEAGIAKSYRSRQPLRVIAEHTHWQGHSPEALKAMKEHLARLEQLGVEPIDD